MNIKIQLHKNYQICKEKFVSPFWLRLKKISLKLQFYARDYSKKYWQRLHKKAPQIQKEHLNSYPAIHFKKMDGFDFLFKFSSEILVLVIVLSVVLLNLIFFTGNHKRNFNDKSFAARFLNYHPNLNKKLSNKNSVIVTTVENSNQLIHQAQAQSLDSLEPGKETSENLELVNNVLNENILTKPNPDSVQSLISKQITVYETRGGDTLGAIAAKNGISVQTLMWTNNLSSEFIKPGWFLIILPTDGMLHKADNNDTLPDIANRYKGDLAKIIAYNGLENAEDIDGGQLIIVPDGVHPNPPRQASRRSSNSAQVNPGTTTRPKYVNNGTGHVFPWGYCTWYVASKTHVPWGGNAKNWIANSRGYGAVISNTPSVGSIVATTDNARYGHVALVEKVEENRIYVSEMNYEAFGKVSYRWINRNSRIIKGYIHP